MKAAENRRRKWRNIHAIQRHFQSSISSSLEVVKLHIISDDWYYATDLFLTKKHKKATSSGMADPNISHSLQMNVAALRMIQQEAARENAIQVESEADLNQYFEVAAFNPMQRMSQFKELHELRNSYTQKKEKAEEELVPAAIEQIEETAERYENQNNELKKRTLLILKELIKKEDSSEEILKKLESTYQDVSLRDEALDFLIETASDNFLNNLKEAKKTLQETYGREIVAGKNIHQWAKDFSTKGLGSPSSLRDLYRDVTGTLREPIVLFNELSEKFSYDKLKPSIDFLLHSLGQDLRAKGSSIPRGELKKLIDEVRSLQAILGVYRFFSTKIPLMQALFSQKNLLWPKELTFENISKLFIRLIAEKFVNPEKIEQVMKLLGLSEKELAQFIVLTQMKDGLKQVAPRYFRNINHREELLKIYLAILEELEEELEEKEREKKGKKRKNAPKEENEEDL